MQLEQEQIDLLCLLVETARSIPRDKRDKFHLIEASNESFLKHWALPNWSPDCYRGDIETLAREGLLNLQMTQNGGFNFDLWPEAFAVYEKIKASHGEPVDAVEQTVRHYLLGYNFQVTYKAAFARWADAERKLWSADSHKELTAIGLLCREAVQEFVDILVRNHKLPDFDPDKSHTIARLKSLIKFKSPSLSSAVSGFLEALLAYFGSLDDLIQRQVHGALKEGQQLQWEDARRIVFQSAVVMYEIERSFNPVSPAGTA
jgi:hypothetical protein